MSIWGAALRTSLTLLDDLIKQSAQQISSGNAVHELLMSQSVDSRCGTGLRNDHNARPACNKIQLTADRCTQAERQQSGMSDANRVSICR